MPKWLRRSLIVVAALFFMIIIMIILGYWFKWDWAGFIGGYSKVTIEKSGKETKITTELPQGKSLWDWLQLLVIPAILAIGGFWLNQVQKDREQRSTEQQKDREQKTAEQQADLERKITLDHQQERLLQAYIDKISELLLKEQLRDSIPTLSIDHQFVLNGSETKSDEEVRTIARARTLTVLSRLDFERKGSVIQFLHESQLLGRDKSVISLNGADLSRADLTFTNLVKANLLEANLLEANLLSADLSEANLSGALLWKANLGLANLSGANLSGANLGLANLSGAKVTQEQLNQAKSLKGAIMPDGSKHP